MALTKELLSVLDNSDEPLPKRLRIANNAFNSSELPAFNKEGVLLQWFSKIGAELDNPEIWGTLHSCLTSQHLRELRQNEIRADILTIVIKTITKRLKEELDSNLKKTLLECATAILKLDLFQQYFRHDMKRYCLLVSTMLSNINDVYELINVINGNLLFNKKIIMKIDVSKYFLSHTFNAVVNILLKFDDPKLFECCARLIQRTIFPFSSKEQETFLNNIFQNKSKTDVDIPPNDLLNKLKELYESELNFAKIGYKLLFVAFVSTHKNQTKFIYQFFILIIQTIGFKARRMFKIKLKNNSNNCDLNKSLAIVADLLDVIKMGNLSFDHDINKISFNNCLKLLTKSVIRLELKPNLSTLKILKHIIVIDPMIIDELISEIIPFIMLSKKKTEMQIFYSTLLISLFEMYVKLHRFHKFTSELLRSLKSALSEKLEILKPDLEFCLKIEEDKKVKYVENVRNIFPDNSVSYFHQCITLQSSKQVVSIMRTFITHLGDIVDDLGSFSDDSNKILYIQITSDLTCQFLSAVRIAEHTITEITINKFLKDMYDLKKILGKFGKFLLKNEHNHALMFSFLNICYTWAEVAILLTFYKPMDDISFKGKIGNDYSASNITYLHNYLSAEQWSLVSQRIKNFGELPCKNILQKLIIQKLRALFLFETEFNQLIETSATNNFATNLETSWEIILSENFLLSRVIPKMDNSQHLIIAEYLVKDILKRNNFDIFKERSLIDSRDLVSSIFYVCLSKISALFKKKRKLDDQTIIKPVSVHIFKAIDSNLFIRNEEVNMDIISEIFCSETSGNENLKIDEQRFCSLLEIIRYLPICSLSHKIQSSFFLYLLSICVDLKLCKNENANCLALCEKYLIGLVENLTSPNIFNVVPADILTTKIIENVTRYKEILSFTMKRTLKADENIGSFKPVIDMLSTNLNDQKYLETSVVILHAINKGGKKFTEENKKHLKKYKIKLCKNIVELLLKEDKIEDCQIEAFVVTLQKYLFKDSNDNLAKLMSKFANYFDYAVNNINENNLEGCLQLFELILRSKAKIENVPDEFILRSWKACKDLQITEEKHSELFNKTVSVIFEHVTNEQFPTILQDLLDSSLNCIKPDKLNDLKNQLKLWNYLLHSSINAVKQKSLHTSLQTLLENMILYLLNNTSNSDYTDALVKLETSIIENKQVPQSPNIIDLYFQTVQIIISREFTFNELLIAFDNSFTIMETLVRRRKALLIDRLPAYLLQYRLNLKQLCLKSNSEQNLSYSDIRKISDCAFRMEKLTKTICSFKKDMARIAPYLIADILKQFEKITLYSEVKTHLNNCLYHLVELCDYHSESYLLRTLSTASTELFKTVHSNYKKYHKFTGKV